MTRLAGPALTLARLRATVWPFGLLPYALRVFGRTPGIQGLVMCRPYFGRRLYLDTSRSNVQKMLFLQGERFLVEAPLLRSILRPGMRVIDVGANIGYYVLFLETLIGPRGRIVAIEPEPDNVCELRRNVRENRLDNVDILSLALGDRNGDAALEPGTNGRLAEHPTGLSVPLRTLDSLLPDGADFVKVDVEGYEGRALAGAVTVLQGRPDLFVEVHPALIPPPDSAAGVLALLQGVYGHVEVFARVPTRGIASKIVARYCPFRQVRQMSYEQMVAACKSGRQREPFWAVCRRGVSPA